MRSAHSAAAFLLLLVLCGAAAVDGAKTLTVLKVKCIKPSSGIDNYSRTLFASVGGAIGGAASLASTVATGGALVGTVGVATVGGASAGVAVISGLDHVFAGSDDLYVKVNGGKVWPSGSSGQSIDSQQEHQLNYEMPLSSQVSIQFWEYDWGSADDFLGQLLVPVEHQTGDFLYAVPHEAEGSIYEVWIRVTDTRSSPTPPAGRAAPTCSLYQHANFQGSKISWDSTTNRQDLNFHTFGFGDQASSAVVEDGCTLTVYEHINREGKSKTFSSGRYPRFGDYSLSVADSWNDDASSWTCRCQ